MKDLVLGTCMTQKQKLDADHNEVDLSNHPFTDITYRFWLLNSLSSVGQSFDCCHVVLKFCLLLWENSTGVLLYLLLGVLLCCLLYVVLLFCFVAVACEGKVASVFSTFGSEAWANEIYQSVEHRAVVNSEKERLSNAFFFNLAHHVNVEALSELIDHQNPPNVCHSHFAKNWCVVAVGSRFCKAHNLEMAAVDGSGGWQRWMAAGGIQAMNVCWKRKGG
ncbi:putative 2-oxoglutarate-dependent dioxygenase [Camellia lanceoleosa]|uniref:2-oxoglutarate-dependent dioxygenase n=1 Tax=Camellia lanceoleosa TaxID=1840588 RepID=A0ACC0F3L1_9ERIC|nr:putative 2-oxoglutarate-dependent dioxygenase [Camellia lanceoleosa]